MPKKAKPIDKSLSVGRSNLSDEVPLLGIGIVPDTRASISMKRCVAAIKNLFNKSGLPFSKLDRQKTQLYLSEDALQAPIMKYWYDHDYDRRTKRSDLKRELTNILTHLRPLNKALNKVHKKTRSTVNYKIYQEELAVRPRGDFFDLAIRTNLLLFRTCEPLVMGKYVKAAPTCVDNFAAAMIETWEAISGEKFKYSTRVHKAEPDRSFTGEPEEFQGPGPHFVHVVLRATDPTVTRANVASSIKNLAPGRRAR